MKLWWKIKYRKNDKIDYLFFSTQINKYDKENKLNNMRKNGFEILSQYKVNKI